MKAPRLAKRGRLALTLTIDDFPLRLVVKKKPGRPAVIIPQHLLAQEWVGAACGARVRWGKRFVRIVLVSPERTPVSCTETAEKWQYYGQVHSGNLRSGKASDRFTNPSSISDGDWGSIPPYVS